jgi:hypothetical protein
MSESEKQALLSQETTDAGTTPVELPQNKLERFVRRPLSEKEMASPGVIQLLLDDRDRLEQEVNRLRRFQSDCSDLSNAVAVLKEKLAASVLVDLLFTVSFGIGVGLLGVTQSGSVTYLAVAMIVCGVGVKIIQTFRQVRKTK